MKWSKNKKGVAPILLILVLGIAILALLWFLPSLSFLVFGSKFLSFVPFQWNGITITENDAINSCSNVNAGGLVSVDDLGILHITSATGNGNSVTKTVQTDISNWDEVMILYEGSAGGYGDKSYGSDGCGSVFARVQGSESGMVTLSQSKCSDVQNGIGSRTEAIDFNVWKFRNNFDGTWTSLQVVGIGSDITKPVEKQTIKGTPYLVMGAVGSGGGCNVIRSGGNAELRVVNVVRKEDQFAVCKADYYYDNGECKKIASIKLEAEESIKESFEERIARLEKQQEANVVGFEEQIQMLKNQNQDSSALETQLKNANSVLANDLSTLQRQIDELRLSTNSITELQNEIAKLENRQLTDTEKQYIETIALEQELAESKQRLADIEAKDKNVIAVVEANEQFKEPTTIKSFFNKIIAFIKNLFN